MTRRHLQILTVLTVLAASSGLAAAQTLNQGKIDAVNKAAESFVALAKDSHTTGKPPRYADPAAKPLLDAVFDTRTIQGTKPLPWSAVEMLEQWNKAATTVGTVYYIAGTGTANVVEVSKDPKKISRANANTAAFAPEFGRYYDARIQIHTALIDTAAARLATASEEDKKSPEFKRTLNYISDSSVDAIIGVLGTFVQEGIQDDWLLSRIVSLLDMAPKAAKFMAPQDRDRIKNAAIEVAGQLKNPDARSGVNFIARAFAQL